MKTYAAYYDNIVRQDSSSGGIFSVLADNFDVVYGVEMDEENSFAVYARKTDDISSLRGSKYIQAKMGDCYNQVKKDLNDEKSVLFTGTACQVNGLFSFLDRDYPNLFTIDVICHGAPTPKYWKKFIEGKKVQKINFRSKDGGWENYTYGMKLNDTYIPYDKNKFMSLYVKDYAIRPSCYECVCKQNKKSDITLGDFWGIEKIDPSMSDNKGTSVVFIRTQRGQELFDSKKNRIIWKEMTYEDGVKQNPSEYKSASRPERRAEFFLDMEQKDFDELYKKYCPTPSFAKKAKWIIKKTIKKVLT